MAMVVKRRVNYKRYAVVSDDRGVSCRYILFVIQLSRSQYLFPAYIYCNYVFLCTVIIPFIFLLINVLFFGCLLFFGFIILYKTKYVLAGNEFWALAIFDKIANI